MSKRVTNLKTVENSTSPNVIVDFEYQNGLLFVSVENIGNDSAFGIVVKFSKEILGMQKTVNVSGLAIFNSLKFLPPGKKIRVFIDVFYSYIANRQPLKITVMVSFSNKAKQKFQNTIPHDLSIYRNFPEIQLKE